MTYIIPLVKLLLPMDYIHQATTAIDNAKSRVYLTSLVVAEHASTRPLIAALEAAAKRGVTVEVAADIFTYGEVNGGFLRYRYHGNGTRTTNQMVKKLKKAGVGFHWLGRGHITLYHGRTHGKWCVVDNTVFTFGGVNLYEEGVNRNVDYMFRLEDPSLADRIAQEQIRIQKAESGSTNFHSTVYEHGGLTVLFDGGIIGQSVIYRRSIELAEKATDITFVSQYCPPGKLSRILKQKHSTIYYNNPSQARGLNRVVIRLAQMLTGLKTSYKRSEYLHAKFIIFTLKDGSKAAITGSHNFAHTGALLGTREIALETTDPAVIKQLEDFVANEIERA